MHDVLKIATLTFDYVNHRGESARRRIRPLRVYYGATDYHEGEHWYLRAFDLERKDDRDFRLDHMANLREEREEGPR